MNVLELPTRVMAADPKSACLIALTAIPLVGDRALKGPVDKIFRELGREPTALGIARYYRDLIDGVVIDTVDADLKHPIEALGLRVMIDDTVMKSPADQARPARAVIDFALNIAEHAHG